MLALATVGFAVTFWAWALLSPLGAALREELGATAFQQSLLVAVPVIVGSLGRIPVGALTDRLGARRMFPRSRCSRSCRCSTSAISPTRWPVSSSAASS
jgi:MFS transporter, NNP family, nitrate/nitrite transporter